MKETLRNLPGSFYDTWNIAVVICDTAILENYRKDYFNLTNINPWLSSFLVTIYNPETLKTLGKQDTGRRQTKN